MVGHRGGLTPRSRVPGMGVGRSGYPFAGHPMDYYCNPYLDEKVDFYGGGRPPHHQGIGKLYSRCAVACMYIIYYTYLVTVFISCDYY